LCDVLPDVRLQWCDEQLYDAWCDVLPDEPLQLWCDVPWYDAWCDVLQDVLPQWSYDEQWSYDALS